MNTAEPMAEEDIQSLVKKYPVEDVWYLDARAARACLLDCDANLVLIVRAGADAAQVEKEAAEFLRREFPDRVIGIHAFPQSTMFQTPRPLLVKMAFSSGSHIYCG